MDRFNYLVIRILPGGRTYIGWKLGCRSLIWGIYVVGVTSCYWWKREVGSPTRLRNTVVENRYLKFLFFEHSYLRSTGRIWWVNSLSNSEVFSRKLLDHSVQYFQVLKGTWACVKTCSQNTPRCTASPGACMGLKLSHNGQSTLWKNVWKP